MKIIEKLERIVKSIYQDHLYRNSFYLILSNIVVGITGFLFWLIAAKFYSTESVGLASVLFSIMSIFMLFSIAGINPSFIRFLPTTSEEDRNKIISTSFFFSVIISVFLSIIFIVFIDVFSPKLHFLKDNYIYLLVFIISIILYIIFNLFNGLFVAKRKSDFLFIKNCVESILKLFPLTFMSFLGSMGIFLSNTIALIFATILSFFLFVRIYPNFKISISIKTIKKIYAFTFANQISTIFLRLPGMLFPMMVLNFLSPQEVAYFYISWMWFSTFIEFILFINSAFLMEASNDEANIKRHEKKTIILSFIFVVGGLFLFFIFGWQILSLFGKEYTKSVSLLHILTISLIPFTINQIYLTSKNIKKDIKEFTFVNILIYSSILIISPILIFYFGIIGTAYGWLVGQMLGILWIVFKRFF